MPRNQSPLRQTSYTGMSPLEAGLTYGGAASTVMGPLGLLVGIGAGIIAKRQRDSFLDREAEYNKLLAGEHTDFKSEVDSELKVADPDEQRLLNHAKRIEAEGWQRLTSGDETGRELVTQANETIRGIINADIQARKSEQASVQQFQRGLIQNAATSYRDEYQKNLSQFEDINSQADRVLKMVAGKGFDPNKPFNKAVLADLLTVGVGGLYRDAPDLLGSIPVVGAFLERGADALSGKFDLTAEDFNKIALSMKTANEQVSEQRMLRLGEQARSLDSFAKQTGAIPQDYSLGLYVTGEQQELNFTEAPRIPQPTETGGTRQLSDVERGIDKLMQGTQENAPWKERVRRWTDKLVGPATKRRLRPTN